MYKCPECGESKILAPARVLQMWVIDKCGLCIDVDDDFVDIVEEPSLDDHWECVECGFTGKGELFYVEDEREE